MGYNRDNYKRIREEYRTKYLRAREAADARRLELHSMLPAVADLDRSLSATGLEIMRVTLEGGEERERKLAEIRERNEILLHARAELLEAAGYPADYTAIHYDCEACGDSGYVDGKMCACMRRCTARSPSSLQRTRSMTAPTKACWRRLMTAAPLLR